MKEIKKGQRVLSTNIKEVADGNHDVILSINVGPNYKVSYKFKDLNDAMKWVDTVKKTLTRAKNGEI